MALPCYEIAAMRTALVLTTLVSLAACDSAVRVGELKSDAGEPGPIVPGADGGDAGALIFSWRQHAPSVPCSIYAMTERAADDVFIGCNGGRVYRFDGVNARLDLEAGDGNIIGLLWAGPNGEVFAAAHDRYDGDKAKTQLHRFDGTKWSKFGDATKRIVSLAGKSELWVATETDILKNEGGQLVSKYQATGGFFRACSFAEPDKGWCVGTNGIGVAYDGATWTPIASPPWSAQAEVFGVEPDPFSKTPAFFFGEPIDHPNGDHSCRITRLGTPYTANIPCFPGFDVARKRTGVAIVNGKTHYLLSVSESYGGSLVYDLGADTVTSLCGPILAFSSGSANTRAGGLYGLLATIVGSGGNQLSLSGFGGSANSSFDFDELSVGSDGTAWARVEDTTSCGSISDRLVRFEDGAWKPVPGPQGALSGRSLAAVSKDRAYTIDLFTDRLLIASGGGWTEGPELVEPWSLFAVKADDVWIGGMKENFGHFDGKTFAPTKPPNRYRQAEQIVASGNDVWLVQQGTTSGDTNMHLVHWDGTNLTDEDLGIQRAGSDVRVSAVFGDPSRVYRSGYPAKAWDGTTWSELPFEANDVWARSGSEIFFLDRGDIWKWDGTDYIRVHHGFIPIRAIGGSKDRGFAVGPGGLTLEFAAWPDEQR